MSSGGAKGRLNCKIGCSYGKYRGYKIQPIENGFRITLDDGFDRYTYIKSKHFYKKLVDYVVDRKVPKKLEIMY